MSVPAGAAGNGRRRIRKGWGYWDTTHYPRGGAFRRSDGSVEGLAVAVTWYANGAVREYRIIRDDGRTAVCGAEATEIVGAPADPASVTAYPKGRWT